MTVKLTDAAEARVHINLHYPGDDPQADVVLTVPTLRRASRALRLLRELGWTEEFDAGEYTGEGYVEWFATKTFVDMRAAHHELRRFFGPATEQEAHSDEIPTFEAQDGYGDHVAWYFLPNLPRDWPAEGVHWDGDPGATIEVLDFPDHGGPAKFPGDMEAALYVARSSEFRWIAYMQENDDARWEVTAYRSLEDAVDAAGSVGGRSFAFDGHLTPQDGPETGNGRRNGYLPPSPAFS